MKTPNHLWIVGILSLLWNAGGGYDYVMSQTENPAYFEMMPPEGIAFLENAPVWFEAAWAFGVWGSILGSLLLLFKSKFAGTAFGISIAGLIVSSIYTYILAPQGSALAFGGIAALVFSIAIPVIVLALFAYARAMTRRGVLT